jgi:LysM repeat protein
LKPIFFLSALFLIGGCQLISTSDEINPNLFQTLASSDYIYEVKEGDSLWSIAKENNLSVKELLQSNPKIRSSSIYPGDKIFISAASELIQSNVWRSPLESNQKMQTSDSWIFFFMGQLENLSEAQKLARL